MPGGFVRGHRHPLRGVTCAVALAIAVLAGLGSADAPVDRFDAVVIDAGHGGDDEGGRGPAGSLEKNVVLDVARRLAAELRARGVRVVMTRPGDTFVSLEERTNVANDARADLFLSIHANAAREEDVRGTETFFLSLDATDDAARLLAERENRALGRVGPLRRSSDDPLVAILGDMIATEHLHESQAFARMAQERLGRAGPGGSRGVKQAPFVVLSGVQMPASLVEIGFLTNAEDERRLRSQAGRSQIAAALAEAVSGYGRRYDARRGLAPLPAHGGR